MNRATLDIDGLTYWISYSLNEGMGTIYADSQTTSMTRRAIAAAVPSASCCATSGEGDSCMYSVASVSMPKLYGTGRLILSREKPVNVAYVIWRWQVASRPTRGVQPVDHGCVLADGLLAMTEDRGPDNASGLLQLEDGVEYTVTLARRSNPAVWEFHIQPADGAFAG